MTQILANKASGTALQDAQWLFYEILHGSTLADKKTATNPQKTVREQNDPSAWLGLWMLRAELTSMTLLGCRLWDVVYQASDHSSEGILPLDRSVVTMDEATERTYTNTKIASHENLTAALKYLVAKYGLEESLDLSTGLAITRPVELIGFTRELEIGEILPFPDIYNCIGSTLSEFTYAINKELLVIQMQRMRDALRGPSAEV